jgi:hypothetical protein
VEKKRSLRRINVLGSIEKCNNISGDNLRRKGHVKIDIPKWTNAR